MKKTKTTNCIYIIITLIIFKEIEPKHYRELLNINKYNLSKCKKTINDTLINFKLNETIGLIYFDSDKKKYILKK